MSVIVHIYIFLAIDKNNVSLVFSRLFYTHTHTYIFMFYWDYL